MFTKHDHYQAACAGCGAQAIDPGSIHADHHEPLIITEGDELAAIGMATAGNNWLSLFAGTLLCRGCGDGQTPDVEPSGAQIRRAMTPGVHYTFHCDGCGDPVMDGDRGRELELPEPRLDDLTVEGLRDEGWQIGAATARCETCVEEAQVAAR